MVLTVGAAVFFLFLACIPGSPGYLRPGSWIALAIALVNLLVGLRVSLRRGWLPVLAAASTTAAMGLAAADAGPGPENQLFLLWFPWIASYCGLLTAGWSLASAGWIALTIVLASSVNPELAAAPGPLISSIVSSVAACGVVHALYRWGRDQVYSDPLTSLVNRAGLGHGADPAIARSRARGREAVLVLLDVNRFREVNDALGHAAGDELLRLIALRLRAVTPEPSFVGRLGGDEFALVIDDPGLDSGPAAPEEHVRLLGQEILRQIQGPYPVHDVEVEVEASAGLAVAPRDGETVAALLPCADAALSRAKRDGERVGLWDAGIAGVRPWEIALYAQLRAAITRGELVLFYQPLQSAPTGRIVGVEALIRWRHPVRGLLPPGSFLPMAERSALIVDLTKWVLDDALRQCAAWAAEGMHMPVSVNLSARMLVLDDLPGLVTASLARHGLPADVLTLEITESALVTQPTRAAAMLRELRTKGVKLALDDFGTGYSSMEILKALPFDEVKIDRSFVTDARGSLPDVAIVRSVLDLGHRLGLRVVSEGVEDDRTMRMMAELGCDILQGDAISKPRPPDRLAGLLAERTTNLLAAGAAGGGEPVEPSGQAGRVGPPEQLEPPARPAGRPGGSGGRPEEVPGAPSGDQARNGAVSARVVSRSAAERFGVVAPIGADEPARQAAARRYGVVRESEPYLLDDIATLAAVLTDCYSGSVMIVESDIESFVGRHGHATSDVPARVGLPSYVIAARDVVEIPDVAVDTRFAHMERGYPELPMRFLAAVPMVTCDGHIVGAVSVGDRIPRHLTPGQREALGSLARQAMVMLDARREALLLDKITDTVQVLDQLWYPDDLEKAAAIVADAARTLLRADVVTVLMSDLPGSTVFSAAAASAAAGEEPAIKPGSYFSTVDDNAVGAALRTQSPVFIPDAAGSPLLPQAAVREYNVASALITPLPGEGGLLGVLSARWSKPMPSLDPALTRALTLLAGQAGHTLGRLRSARARAREFGTDPETGLTSRAAFLSTLQSLPAGTGVCLFAVGGMDQFGPPSDASGGGEPDQVAGCFAAHIREICDNPKYLARWSETRFVMAVPTGGGEEAESAVIRLRRAWEREPMPPFMVGIAVTRSNEPPSAALIDAEKNLLEAIAVARSASTTSAAAAAAAASHAAGTTAGAEAPGAEPPTADCHTEAPGSAPPTANGHPGVEATTARAEPTDPADPTDPTDRAGEEIAQARAALVRAGYDNPRP